MRISSRHRGLVVTAVGALLLVLGMTLALADKPAPPKTGPGAKSKPPAVTLDCKALEQQLSKCGPAIAAAFDSGLGARLAKQPPLLRGAVLRTISKEFAARVAGPCFARKGQLKQGEALGACMSEASQKAKATACKSNKAKCATVRQLARCRTLATCLAAKVRALPSPKKKAAGTKPAPGMRPAPSAKPADMKARSAPGMKPAAKKK